MNENLVDLQVPAHHTKKRMDAFLAEAFQKTSSRQNIQLAIKSHKLLLNGNPAKPKTILRQGDKITGVLEFENTQTMVAENIPLKVIYEDKDIIVIDKPAGMVVHPGAGNKTGTLANALLGRASKWSTLNGSQRPGIVHRLDKDTSGVILAAKNDSVHRHLQVQFAERTISKTYQALVKGVVEYEEGHIDQAIGRDPKSRIKMAVTRPMNARSAQTYYKVLRRFSCQTLLEVKITTGRTHQIRVHLSHAGFPVIGDKLYGKKSIGSSRLGLHASKIQLIHPVTGKIMTFVSEPPDDFKKMIFEAEKDSRSGF